jgi:hypothetical protein
MKKTQLKALLKVIIQEVVAAKQKRIDETKRLSGLKKSPTSKNMGGLKEDILGMIREELEKHPTNEHAKRTASLDPDTGILDASVSADRRKPDSTSPTGYRLIGKFEIKDLLTQKVIQVVPDGTPITAPSHQKASNNPNMGRPKKDAAAPSTIPSTAPSTNVGSDDNEDDEDDGDDQPMTSAKPNSKVIVKLNGKKIGNFDFRLPSGKISADTMEKNLYRIEELANYNLTPSVEEKYKELEDLFYADKLLQGSTLDLVVDKSKLGEPSVIVPNKKKDLDKK